MTKKDALLLIKNKSCRGITCPECIGIYLPFGKCAKMLRNILIDRFIKGEDLTAELTKEELCRFDRSTYSK